MYSGSPELYRDSEDDERAMPQRRVDKWADQDTIGTDSSLLIRDSNNGVHFDLEFDEGDGIFKPGKRVKPWMIFGALSAFTLL